MNKQPATAVEPEDLDLSDRKKIYLEAIRAGLDYSDASAHAGVDRSTSYRWRQDPDFAALVKQAQVVSVEDLKREAHRRAMRGSDRLIEFLLVNRAPEEFQSVRNALALSGSLALTNMTDEEIRAELAAFAAQGIVPPTNDSDDISDLL